MNICMFGVLTVHDGDRVRRGRELGGAKSRAILELLLLARGRPVVKDALADAMWGSHPPTDAIRTLEHYVCVLRHRLWADQDQARAILVTGPNSYRIDPEQVDIDIDRFDLLLMRSEQHLSTGRRRQLLGEAVSIARGDLLEESPYATWAQLDRHRYREKIARAHLWLADDHLRHGDVRSALRHSESALQFAEFSEHAYRIAMVANYAIGCDDMARSAYLRCRTALRNELALDPTAETLAIAAAIDAGAPVAELTAMIDAGVASTGPRTPPSSAPRCTIRPAAPFSSHHRSRHLRHVRDGHR